MTALLRELKVNLESPFAQAEHGVPYGVHERGGHWSVVYRHRYRVRCIFESDI